MFQAPVRENISEVLFSLLCLNEKEKSRNPYGLRDFWRSGRDSNSRAGFAGNTISSRARYDHFDTTAYRYAQQRELLYQKSP